MVGRGPLPQLVYKNLFGPPLDVDLHAIFLSRFRLSLSREKKEHTVPRLKQFLSLSFVLRNKKRSPSSSKEKMTFASNTNTVVRHNFNFARPTLVSGFFAPLRRTQPERREPHCCPDPSLVSAVFSPTPETPHLERRKPHCCSPDPTLISGCFPDGFIRQQ